MNMGMSTRKKAVVSSTAEPRTPGVWTGILRGRHWCEPTGVSTLQEGMKITSFPSSANNHRNLMSLRLSRLWQKQMTGFSSDCG